MCFPSLNGHRMIPAAAATIFSTMETLEALHARMFACRLCQEAGYIELARPVTSGIADNRVMLVGQAPGITEIESRKPFAGRAGRELFRWMASIDIPEEEFRRRVYMTAVTKCYPGRAASGSGDRRPSRAEIELCRPYLAAQLALVKPAVIVPVGGLALEVFLPKMPLSELIGQRFERAGVVYIPLPHPSGASRWLNLQENKDLLRQALAHVRFAWSLAQ